MDATSVALARPWTLRLLEALPVAPIWVGAAISTLVLALFFGTEFALGQLSADADAHLRMHFRIATVTALFVGFFPTAQLYLERWTRQHLAQLRSRFPGADLPAEPPVLRSRRTAGVLGALALPLLFLVAPFPLLFLERDYWTFEHAWDWLLLPVTGWFMGRLLHALVANARHFSQLAPRIGEIDLFDRDAFAPFVRQGLRSALLVLVILWISTGLVGIAVVSDVSGVLTWLVWIGIAGSVLLLPLRGVRRRIRDEKRARLAVLRQRLRGAERALREGGAAAQPAAAALPALLALEARLEAVREWPLDASSLLRFGLYAAVGLGSWLGAALVERVLDAALR